MLYLDVSSDGVLTLQALKLCALDSGEDMVSVGRSKRLLKTLTIIYVMPSVVYVSLIII